MKKLTAYISGPMSHIKNLNEPLFRTWESILNNKGFNTIVPHDIAALKLKHGDWEMHMRADLIEMLRRADFIVTLPDWEKSAGATIEKMLADLLNIPVLHYPNVKHANAMKFPLNFKPVSNV
jgi:hypothetical protein